MAAQTVTVQFHDQTLTAAVIDDKPYVAMKPICENIGLEWRSQYNRIKRHPVLNSAVFMMNTPSKGGEQKMLMLPLDYLNGWLFGIDISRIRDELKPRLMEYQSECFKVLADYFMPKTAALPEPPVITKAQQGELFALVANKAHTGGKSPAYFWSRFQNHFKVSSYKLLPASRFNEACEFLHRLEGLEMDSFLMLTHKELSDIIRQNIEGRERRQIGRGCPEYHYPIADWQPENRVGATAWLTYREISRVESYQRPISRLLAQLRQDGHDVEGARAEYRAYL
ncbi:MAG: phage antirepressor N-terminal domain-containing protein, partial [Gammaproteobacteria bacterium]